MKCFECNGDMTPSWEGVAVLRCRKCDDKVLIDKSFEIEEAKRVLHDKILEFYDNEDEKGNSFWFSIDLRKLDIPDVEWLPPSEFAFERGKNFILRMQKINFSYLAGIISTGDGGISFSIYPSNDEMIFYEIDSSGREELIIFRNKKVIFRS